MLSRRTATLEYVPDGTPGVVAKVKRIRVLVEAAKRSPTFRDRAAALVQHVAEKDHDAEISTLVEHVRHGVRYLRDPWSPTGLELFIEPETMLHDVAQGRASGDCDDHVLLASALLETAGYPTRYRVGGSPPDNWQHIWLDVEHPRKGWLPVELTRKDMPIGADPSPRFILTKTLGAMPMTSQPFAELAALPPSAYNAVPIAASPVPWGSTPSDFLRAVERGRVDPQALFGLGETLGRSPFKKLKKLRKKLNPFAMSKKLLKKSPLFGRFLGGKKKQKGRRVVEDGTVEAPGVEYTTAITGGPQFVSQQPMPYPGQPLVADGSGYVQQPGPASPMPPPSGSYVSTEWDFAQAAPESFDFPASNEPSENYDPEFGENYADGGGVVYEDADTDERYGTLGGADWARKIGLGQEAPWWQGALNIAQQTGLVDRAREKLVKKGYLRAPPIAAAAPPPPLVVQQPPPQIIYRTAAAKSQMPLIAAAAAVGLLLLMKRK